MLLKVNQIEDHLIVNPHAKKLFVFDLDGTIVYDGMRMENRFENKLRDIVEAGHSVYYATGRSYRDYLPMIPEWSHEFPAVVFGGGLVIHQQDVLHKQFLESDKLLELIKFLEEHKINYLLDGQNSYYHSHDESWILTDIIRICGQKPIHSPENILSDGAYKILILDLEWRERCQQIANQNNWVLKYHSYNNCFDLMPSGVNKFNGLKYLPLIDNQDIFIFGNDHNDLELMQNHHNNIMFGDCRELQEYAKVKISYDDDLFTNFAQVVDCILKK